MLRAFDALAFSSALVAAIAAGLVAASARVMAIRPSPALLALAACGACLVYCVDRLRDAPRDRLNSPLRTRFVERHRSALLVLSGTAAAGALASAVHVSGRVLVLAAAVAAFGFAHRRLKHIPWAKPVYLTGAWTAVAVGFPAADAPAAAHLGWTLPVVALTLQANIALSNLRDAEALAGRLGRPRVLGLAWLLLAAAAALAWLGPPGVRPLVWLPLALVPAVAAFQDGERFGAWAVDGALLAGSAAALALTG
jgi:4-hydroxybenzoate polyprenyltransferase